MEINVPVNHNYNEEAPITESALCETFNVKKTNKNSQKLQQFFSSVHELKLGADQLKQIKILNFKHRYFEQNEERLILKLYSKEMLSEGKKYFIQTGLYAGVLFHKGCKINITTKYGDAFLKRMLNFVNDIYVDNERVEAEKDEVENKFLFIIAYLFIQALEKAAILGLPQQYKNNQERSHKVRGRINFNEYLKKDIPFQGKLTSNFRERIYVQEIIDVLHLSLRKLERLFGKKIHSNLFGISQLLKQSYSGHYINYKTIQGAKNHQSINNPMYKGFKKVLEYAEIILLNKDLMPDTDKQQLTTTGYLFDISELYELYLEKLLERNFPEWYVNGQEELKMYQQQFFSRSMFPDLVMRHKKNGNVVVLDAKFKKMVMQNQDIDRADLHQIHSYSGYFGNNLIASGLIYPLSRFINTNKAHSKSLYGNNTNEVNFIVDGIYVSEDQSIKEVIKSEDAFIGRISTTIDKYNFIARS